MALPKLVVELAAKIREYMADLDKAATATEVSAARIERADKTMVDAAKGVASGQADVADTAVQVASRMGPMGGAVAAAAAVVAGYALVSYKAAQENTALVKALALSGNQAGVTAGQLQGLATAASHVVGTHGQAAEAIGLMVSSGKVAGENLQALTVTALNASRTLGIGVQETVKHYEALADSPAKASAKLNEAMGYLNAETYRRIQALEEMGRKDEAAALAQQTYARGVDDATKKVEASLGTLQRGWRNVGEAAGKAWDWMLGLGRKDEVQDSLAGLRQQLDVKERQLRAGFASTAGGAAVGMRGMSDDRRGQLEAEAEGLREQIRLMGRAGATAAQNAAASAKYQQESIEWSAKAAAAEERLKSNATKRADAIAEADKRLAQGYITQTERNNLVADAEQRYADKVTKGNDGERERLRLLKLQQHDLDELVKQILAREKAEHDAGVAATKAYDQVIDRQDKATASAEKELEQQLALNAAMGLSKVALAELAATKLEETAASKERRAALADEIDWSGRMGDSFRDEAAALYALAKAKRDGAAKETALDDDKAWKKNADDMAKEGQRAAQKIEDSLTDALMRGFESGKDFAMVLRDTVVNMFKTMVLKPVISAIVNPVAGAITGGLGLSGAANAATGAASGASLIGSSIGALGTGLGAGAGMIAGGGVGGWLSASTSLIGTGTAAGAMAGIGALAGPIGAVLAIGSLLKSLDSSGTYHTGGLGSYSAAGGMATGDAVKGQGLDFGLASKDYTASSAQAATQMAQAVVGLLDSTATTFGQKAGAYAATAFADDTSKDGAWGALMVKIGDQMVIDWKNGTDKWPGREFSNGETGAKEYAAAVAKDVRDYLITQTPDWADAMLSALGDTPTLENLSTVVAQINAAAAAMDGMGKASQAFAGMSEAAASALITAMGGAEAAVANLSGYYTNFYSESERAGIATADLTKQLADMGKELPTSREAFRALVDAAVAAGDTKLAAGLISLQDEFAALTPAAEKAATAVSSVLTGLQSTTKSLQREIIELQGGDLRAFDTEGMTVSERAAYDLNASLTTLRDSLKASQTAATETAATQQQAAADTLSAWKSAQQSMAQGWLEGAQKLENVRYESAQRELDAARQAASAIATARTSAAQASIEAVRGIAGALTNAREALTGAASQPLTTTSYRTARGLIDQAAATGNLNQSGLEDALKVVSGNTQTLFGRFEDWAMAQAAAAEPVAKLDAQAQGQMAAAQAIIAAMTAQEEEAALRYDESKRVLGDQHDAVMDSMKLQYETQLAQIEATNAVGARFEMAVSTAIAAAAGGGGGGGGVAMPDFSGLTDAIRKMATSFSLSYEQAASLVQKGASPITQNGNTTFVMSDGTVLTAPTGSADAAKYQEMWDTSIRLRNQIEQQTGAYFFTGLEGEVNYFKSSNSMFDRPLTASEFLSNLRGRGVDVGSISGGTQADLYKYLEQYGIKPYATGINVVPHDQLAYIHKGEAVVPAAFNPFNPDAARPMSSDDAVVVAELRSLNARTEQNEALLRAIAGHLASTDRKWARVIKSDAITTEPA